MKFTPVQIEQLIPLLKNYDLIPRGVLIPSLQHSLVSSVLQKLRTPDAVFTKQEYTVMAMAVQFEIDRLQSSSAKVPNALVVLRGQLFALASPV